MLCPNVMDISDRLATTYTNMIKLDGFAYACNSITIAKLSPDPGWLPSVRNHISVLSDACVLWMQKKPEIWSQVLIPFSNYTNIFYGFTEVAKKLKTKDEWLEALQQLKQGLEQAKNATSTVTDQYQEDYQKIKDVQILLEQSINDAWTELSKEEVEMQKIAAEIQHLQDTVANLEDDLSGKELRAGKSYIQTTVTMTYKIISTAGESIPFLSAAGLAFTVGKMFYDIFKDSSEIHETLKKLTEAQNKASEVAQAAAATKMVLHTTYNLEKQFMGIQNHLPYLTEMWSNELEKVKIIINAIESGADPNTYFDLQTMPSALATWQTLNGYCQKMTLPPKQGKPVEIKISDNKTILNKV